VKELNFGEGNGVLVKKVKCNFRTMGKKFGKLMKAVAAKVDALSQDEIAAFEQNGTVTFDIDGQQAVVEVADVEIFSEDIPGWLVANEGKLTVALDVTLTDDLKKEGMARELINRIQNLRKDSGLDIVDRINITVEPNENTDASIEAYREYISTQVLANSITVAPVADGTELDFDDFKLNVKIEKA
jgi:isoleucyl-tRNA synthetase